MPALEKHKLKEEFFSTQKRNQQTIGKPCHLSGMGLFFGQRVLMRFVPAPINSGIIFKRVDLPNQPLVHALCTNVVSTSRTTVIAENGVIISCVEHVLSALYAYQIDNLIIELDNCEPPVADGSSSSFVSMIKDAQIVTEKEQKLQYYLNTPQFIEKNDCTIVAIPSPSLKFSYTLSYKDNDLLGSQYHCFDPAVASYEKDISVCRTFALVNEVKQLIDAKVIQNLSLDYGLIIDGEKLLHDKTLHFSNEMARHKILDMMGDFALLGKEVVAHFIAIKSGHELNVLFSKQIITLIGE